MTNEEKEMLLKDLCARLPYGLLVKTPDHYSPQVVNSISDNLEVIVQKNLGYSLLYEAKPYLRPMDSMTEDERNELRNILWFGYPSDDNDRYSHRGIEVKQCLYDDEKHSTYDFDDFRVFENFLLKKHLDYRGLIPMGLALEAPEDMYNTNTN